MKVTNIGTRYSHRKNAFCDKAVSKCYFASVFETDFLFEKDGKLQRGEKGDAIIMPPGTVIYHGPAPESETGFINDWVYFFSESEITELPLCTPFKTDGAVFRRHLEEIERELALKQEFFLEKTDLILRETLIDLKRKPTGKDPMENVYLSVLQFPEKNITVSEAARLCGYSISRFSEVFKARYGTGLKKLAVEKRMEKAQRMLDYGGKSVQDVAVECGYTDVYLFSKLFKKHTGVPPSKRKNKTALTGGKSDI